MTDGNPFTQEELEELLDALNARRSQLAKMYINQYRVANPDWDAREKRICNLRDKIIGMLK